MNRLGDVVGGNPQAVKSYRVGLDYVRLVQSTIESRFVTLALS